MEPTTTLRRKLATCNPKRLCSVTLSALASRAISRVMALTLQLRQAARCRTLTRARWPGTLTVSTQNITHSYLSI